MSQLFKHILDFPTAYRAFQNLIRKKSISTYEIFAKYIEDHYQGYKIIDIGCGDALIASFFDKSTDYTGIDYNPKYIKKAQENFPHFNFQTAEVEEINPETEKVVYLLIGVIHHLSDTQVRSLIGKIKGTNPNSPILCFDGVRLPKQKFIAKLLKDLDRGNYVRTPEGYQDVLPGFNFIFRSDLLSVPYDHIISTYNFDTEQLNNFIDKMRK